MATMIDMLSFLFTGFFVIVLLVTWFVIKGLPDE